MSKRILHIAFEEPNKVSGGGLAVYQTGLSLLRNYDVDYLGKSFDGLDELTYSDKVFLEASGSFSSRIRSLLAMSTTTIYDAFIKSAKEVDWSGYDCVVIDATRYLFAVKYAKRYELPVFIRVFNAEVDYLNAKFGANKTLIQEYVCMAAKRAETLVCDLADGFIFLTQNDKSRFFELYGRCSGRDSIIPICLEEKLKRSDKKYECEKVSLLATGSLWLKPNQDGILWFICEVLPVIRESYPLVSMTVAGSHPSRTFIDRCSKSGVRVAESPDENEMDRLFLSSDIYVAPILDGAGMKVKVAEALSRGLPVAATPHALIGYHGIQGFLCVASGVSSLEFANSVCKLVDNLKNPLLQPHEIQNLFNEHYSMEASAIRFREVIDGLV